uniref:B30.2/SPRY domain-containing protein n=1 Tax=Denticeps clupeoides TaxID=299321 RepID=A0AAY4DPM8_9TELE
MGISICSNVSGLYCKNMDRSSLRNNTACTSAPNNRVLITQIFQNPIPDSCPLALDPCTAHPSLRLSQSNTVVRMMTEPTPYSDHPDRFDHWQQVLCTESLAAKRSYWEVDWSGTEVDVAVAYRTISRKGSGNECSFGWNEQSWSLYCSNSKFSFTHSGRSTVIPVPMSMRIGVYLDHRAGTLAFYSVADSMQLLHRVQTTFSEPLYPGFGLWGYGTILRL